MKRYFNCIFVATLLVSPCIADDSTKDTPKKSEAVSATFSRIIATGGAVLLGLGFGYVAREIFIGCPRRQLSGCDAIGVLSAGISLFSLASLIYDDYEHQTYDAEDICDAKAGTMLFYTALTMVLFCSTAVFHGINAWK